MKVLKIVLAVILATGVVIGIALPGLAAAKVGEYQADDYQLKDGPAAGDRVPRKMLGGKVVEIDEGKSFFVIQRGEEESVSIAVDNGTQYLKMPAPRMRALRQRIAPRNGNQANADEMRPVTPKKLRRLNQGQLMKRRKFDQRESRLLGASEPTSGKGIGKGGPWNPQRLRRFGEKATFDDINIGNRVAVRLVPGQDEPLARLVLIFEPSAYQRVRGTITAISPEEKTITIAPDNGDEAVTLNYNDDTTFVLKGTIAVTLGQSIRAVYHGEDLMVKVVKVHPESE